MAAYPAVKLLQLRLKADMHHSIAAHRLPDTLLDRFADIDKDASVQWEEAGRECRINGRMYDVVSVETISGHKIFHCICDEDEDKAIDLLNQAAAREPSKTTPGQKWIVKFISELFSLCFLPANQMATGLFAFVHKAPSAASVAVLKDNLQEISIPPPERL